MPSSQTTSYSLWTPTKQLPILSHQDFDSRSQLPSHPLSLWSFWESCVLIHPAHGPLSYWLISRIFLMSPTIRFLLVSRIELPWLLSGKVSACKAGDVSSIPGLWRSPGEGNTNPLQYCCLGNPMDRGTSQATVHGVAKGSDTA